MILTDPTSPPIDILLSVGDPSADAHASELMRNLKIHHPNVHFLGMGGPQMQAQGLECIVDSSELAVLGFVEIIAKYRRIREAQRALKQALITRKPKLVILLDYAAFNLRLAKIAKALGLPVLYYICPQIWASRRYRLRTLKHTVDHCAVIFPFEKAIYQQQQIPVSYVGHPLLLQINAYLDTLEKKQLFTQDNSDQHMNSMAPVIGLVPGSRSGEIHRLLPVMLETARLLKQQYPDARFLLPRANNIPEETIVNFTRHYPELNLSIQNHALYDTIAACDVLIATSGTVTLEIALLQKPYVLIYKVNRFTAWLAKRLLLLPYIGICNVIMQRKIIPELLQDDCQPEKIASAVNKILTEVDYREGINSDLRAIKLILDEEQVDKTITDVVLKYLGKQSVQ